MAGIKCKQCDYVNEGERVYCHNCGTKLDRHLLPQEDKKKESPEQTMRRVKRMTNPRTGFFAGGLRSLINTLIYSVVVAALILALRSPDRVPPQPKKGEIPDAPPIAMALEEALSSPAPRQLRMSEEAINSYLQASVRSKPDQDGGFIAFERAFVNLDEGVCRIFMQQSILGYRLYACSAYQLETQGGKLLAKTAGGQIGRLPVHPLIMSYADIAFQRLWDALKRERKLLDSMQSIQVQKGNIVVTTGPGGTLPAR
jgi:hypothetical protein